MKSKAKEKAMKYLKDKQMMDIEEGDIPLSKRDCSKAIDIAIQETKKEIIEKIDKFMQNSWAKFRSNTLTDVDIMRLWNKLKRELEDKKK